MCIWRVWGVLSKDVISWFIFNFIFPDNYRLSSDVLQRLKRSNEYDGAPIELNFAAFNKSFDISLRYNHVIANPDLPVIIRTANSERVKRMRIEDCYMIGETSRGGVVALSYCNGIVCRVSYGTQLNTS